MAWVGSRGYRPSGLAYSNYYMTYRHYGTKQGQWTTRDPIWPRQRSYAYAYSNPASVVDPSGLFPVGCVVPCAGTPGCAAIVWAACSAWSPAYSSFSACLSDYSSCGVPANCAKCLSDDSNPPSLNIIAHRPSRGPTRGKSGPTAASPPIGGPPPPSTNRPGQCSNDSGYDWEHTVIAGFIVGASLTPDASAVVYVGELLTSGMEGPPYLTNLDTPCAASIVWGLDVLHTGQDCFNSVAQACQRALAISPQCESACISLYFARCAAERRQNR